LSEGLQVVAAAQVLQVRIGDGEVGCEHGRGDFPTVHAVADKGVDETRSFSRLQFAYQYCV
jgi:hypothetical protein